MPECPQTLTDLHLRLPDRSGPFQQRPNVLGKMCNDRQDGLRFLPRVRGVDRRGWRIDCQEWSYLAPVPETWGSVDLCAQPFESHLTQNLSVPPMLLLLLLLLLSISQLLFSILAVFPRVRQSLFEKSGRRSQLHQAADHPFLLIHFPPFPCSSVYSRLFLSSPASSSHGAHSRC